MKIYGSFYVHVILHHTHKCSLKCKIAMCAEMEVLIGNFFLELSNLPEEKQAAGYQKTGRHNPQSMGVVTSSMSPLDSQHAL